MTRLLSSIVCAARGHRWGVECTSPAGIYAPRVVCRRCGLPKFQDDLPLTPREAALGLLTLACVAAAVLLAVLTAGGAPW